MRRKIGPLPDIVDAQTRSRMMSGIRGKNTKPELLVRKGLHARGFRFRLHSANVPGKPDLVLKRYHAAVFVHGCFWHSHDCHLFRMPSTRPEFWKAKLERNCARDQEVRSALLEAGWRLLVIWECAIKGKYRLDPDDLLDRTAMWIRGENREGEIAGRPA
jgi:DNA mismatch endonuclease (patch repair protein)